MRRITFKELMIAIVASIVVLAVEWFFQTVN
jgi:hypothetical protein